MPQGGRAARRLRADRTVVLQGRQDRRTERHLQGCGRAAGEGNPGQGRLEGSHVRERHDRAAARRLRPVRLVADLSGSARAGGRFRRPVLFEGLAAAVPQGQRRTLQDGGRRQQARRDVLGHLGRERGAAHSAAVPGQAEGHHDDRSGLARRRAGARQEGRRVDQRRQRRDPAGEAQRKLGACDRSGQSARPAAEHAGDPLRRSGVEEASSTSTASS